MYYRSFPHTSLLLHELFESQNSHYGYKHRIWQLSNARILPKMFPLWLFEGYEFHKDPPTVSSHKRRREAGLRHETRNEKDKMRQVNLSMIRDNTGERTIGGLGGGLKLWNRKQQMWQTCVWTGKKRFCYNLPNLRIFALGITHLSIRTYNLRT